ncbi:MAG: AAA family ATPase [Chloroflexota bacterium]
MENLTLLAQSLVKAVRQIERAGHTHIALVDLMTRVQARHSVSDADLEKALTEALDAGVLVRSELETETVIYVPSVYQMEKSVAQRLVLMATKKLPPMSRSKLQATLRGVQRAGKLSDEQYQAVVASICHKIAVLTGGPGTGKTTTLKGILEVADKMNISYMLAAPTGQAAKRMMQSTGREASTIHRMLGYNPETEDFAHNPDNYLPTDMLVIDEASMLDLWLVHHLLRAIHEDTRILFVGDVHQLPSVGAGNVLKDIMLSDVAQVSNLTTIFRQSEDSHIVTHARAINAGQMPVLDNSSADFFMFRVADEQVTDLVTDLVANRIPDNFAYRADEIQVLAATYKGVGGVNEINASLQQEMVTSNWSVKIKGNDYKVGDRVIQTKNNYEDDVMNGQVGQICFIDRKKKVVSIMFDDNRVNYSYVKMAAVKLAYAITTHRSQGSEYPVVVIPVTKSAFGLQRNLLYTAITRAKKMVILVGSDEAVQAAIDNIAADKRCTALAYRIQQQ